MKRILKIMGLVLGVVLLVLLGWGLATNEALPKGTSGRKADQLAQKMLATLQYDAYKDTRFLEWSFANGNHRYRWDKVRGFVFMEMGEYQLELHLTNPNKSTVKKNGERLSGEEAKKIFHTARDNFNNDSFWLVAPYKVFDPGTERQIVDQEDGTQGLLITYTDGGSTPGDSYLWLFDEKGFPKAFKIWAKILPVGGVKATWENWAQTKSGAFLPQTHKIGPISLQMGDVKGY